VKITGQGTVANRKRVDYSMNLTSFIDIFSMLIFFLIFNMVLNEVAAIQMQMGSDQASTTPIPEPVKEVEAALQITLTATHVDLLEQGRVKRIPYTEEEDFDWSQVSEFLQAARAKFPQKQDIIVRSRDAVSYGMLVKAMDYSLGQEFKELVVMGTE
jgi:biopolymer transport protein ExbD